MMNANRLGPGEEINIHPSNLTLAKFNIAGTRAVVCRVVFLPTICRKNGRRSNFCSALCKYTCFGCSYTGYITDGINIWKLCQYVSPVNRDPSILGHAALKDYVWRNMFWDPQEQVVRNIGVVIKNSNFSWSVKRTHFSLGYEFNISFFKSFD